MQSQSDQYFYSSDWYFTSSDWLTEEILIEELYYKFETNSFCPSSSKTKYTPLHFATETNDLKAVKSLLSENVNWINTQNEDGWTPLHFACKNSQQDNLEIIKVLLNNNADPSLKTEKQLTPLHIACLNLHGSAVELLLERGVDVNVKDSYGRTVLHHIAGEMDARFKFENTSYEETRTKKQKIAEVLLNFGADIEAKDNGGKTPIFFAAGASDVKITNILLTRGSDINVTDNKGLTPLYYTTLNKWKDFKEVFDDDLVCMKLYKEQFQAETMKLLLESGVDITVKPPRFSTVLHIAINENNIEAVNNLLKSGYDIDAKDFNGLTALHFASRIGHSDVISMLLLNGADINAIDNFGLTPVMLAKEHLSHNKTSVSGNLSESLLKKHILKLTLARLNAANFSIPLSEINRENFKKYCIKCLIELKLMKATMIGDTGIDYFQILKCKNTLLMRNERIVEVIESRAYESKFPEYAGILRRCFNEARKRIKLIDAVLANNYSHVFSNILVECIEKILSYLENDDLKALIVSTNDLSDV